MSITTNTPAFLQKHGLRITPQRLAVAEMVFAKPMHITARSVFEQLRQLHPGISMNTIYLTLGQFESSGLLQRFEVNGNTVFDSNTHPHDHAYCTTCGGIIDLGTRQSAQPAFPAQLDQWNIHSERRMWIGVCPTCNTQTEDPSSQTTV